jgi:hypothetical protein
MRQRIIATGLRNSCIAGNILNLSAMTQVRILCPAWNAKKIITAPLRKILNAPRNKILIRNQTGTEIYSTDRISFTLVSGAENAPAQTANFIMSVITLIGAELWHASGVKPAEHATECMGLGPTIE